MFSHNGRISERQLRRMLVLSVFAGGIFVIPHLSAKLFGESVFWGLCIFFVFACIYVGCIYKLAHHMHFVEQASENGFAGRMVLTVQALRQFCRLVYFLLLSVAILGEAQVPFMKNKESSLNLLVVLPLLLVSMYGALGEKKESEKQPYRIEKQGRLYEMIFWVLFIPFIIVVLFGFGNLHWQIFVPKLQTSLLNLCFYAYLMLGFLLPVENYLYLRPCLADKKGQKSYFAVMGAVGIMMALTLALLGIYGLHGAGEESMLTIAIMRYIKVPFGVVERVDSIVVWFFTAGCFALVSLTLYFTGYLLSVLFPAVKRFWLIGVTAVAAMIVSAFLPDYEVMLPAFMQYGALVDLPLSLLMPLLLRGISKTAAAEHR